MIPFWHRAAPSTMEENPLWLVVLCDMMTNLMLFFLLMYSFTLQSEQKKREWVRTFEARDLIADPTERRAQEALKQFHETQAAEALTELMRRAGLSESSEILVTEEAIRVRLKDQLLFELGEAALAPQAHKALGLLSRVLKEIPNQVIIEGHTDSVPISAGPYRTNWELSVARSQAVIERLAGEGIAAGRLVASGYGEHRPLAPNDSPEGREKNRRVEILILRSDHE